MISWLLLLATAVLPSWVALAQLSNPPAGTGCTKFGRATQFSMPGLPPGVHATGAVWYSVVGYFPGGGNNNYGWCIKNYQLTPFFVDVVTDAIGHQYDNGYVNVPVLNDHTTLCTGMDTATCTSTIIAALVEGVAADLENGESECQYPTDMGSYVPTSHDCSFECLEGYDLSDGTCVAAPSGPSRVVKRKATDTCPFGETRCAVAGAGWECLDLSGHLESCGGCPGTRASVDCTAIDGAQSVECRRGQCYVTSCVESLDLVNGECRA